MAKRFDVVVIGSGPGGYVAAIRAAQLGKKVACIEKETFFGGTCLNVGCIPSKNLLHWTEQYYHLKTVGRDHGFDGSAIAVNWEQLQKSKDASIDGLRMGIKGLFRKNKVTVFTGRAHFVSSRMIEVLQGDVKETVEATDFIVASGSEPIPLPFLPFDEKRVLSSTGALSLPEVPKTMTVIGAGAIGVEMASVYNRLGTQVTVVEMLDKICPGIDIAVGKVLFQELQKQGIAFRLSTEVSKAKVNDDNVSLIVKEDKEKTVLDSEVVLVSVGRRPYYDGLGLAEVGVGQDDQGRVLVDDSFRSSVPNIYAIGDLIDGPQLAHRASEEGVVVAENLAGKGSTVNYMAIPNVIYTSPEVASVGFTESEAREIGMDISVGTFPFKANSRARCTGEDGGVVKVVGEKSSGRLIGMHIVGPHAGELIQQGVQAIAQRLHVADIAHAPCAHPTLSEAVKEAALATIGKPIHL